MFINNKVDKTEIHLKEKVHYEVMRKEGFYGNSNVNLIKREKKLKHVTIYQPVRFSVYTDY